MRSLEDFSVMLVCFTKKEEKEHSVKVTLVHSGGRMQQKWWLRLKVTCEVVEGKEEVAGNEKGFVGERERVEVVEGKRKEVRGGEEEAKTAAVMEREGEDGVAEI